jgi:hypothetical protein
VGNSGRGSFLLGTTFGQRFTVAPSGQHCFTFLSSDGADGLAQRVVYRYGCSASEQPRAELERFLRDVRLVGDGFVESAAMPAAASAEAADARGFALGHSGEGAGAFGLTETPLGYAVWNPVGGG